VNHLQPRLNPGQVQAWFALTGPTLLRRDLIWGWDIGHDAAHLGNES
jgi:hypothetical protein